MTTATETKICKACHEERPLEDYYKNKNSKDGLFHQCKPCDNDRRRVNYNNNVQRERDQYKKKYRNRIERDGNEWMAARSARRRAAIAQAEGPNFTKLEWRYLKAIYNNRCANCQSPENITVDHVIPISAGGSNKIDNIQPLCLSCNASKGTDTTDYRTVVLTWQGAQNLTIMLENEAIWSL